MSTYCNPNVSEELSAKIANTIRFLAADGIQAANSGHPGTPMGCSDIATVLLTRFLRVDQSDPSWFNRDRFVLSAGHGSMLVYSMLHLQGYLKLDDLKDFRQHGSMTPGHPERGHVPGVDVTTGPLGAGFSTAVGLALAERMLAARYNTDAHEIIDHFTYVVMGDGCMMEGVTNEAASFAGHLKLGKLIAFYDDNEISIEGDTDIAFTEDVNGRFEAMGWHVIDIADGHDQIAIADAVQAAQKDDRPSVIVCHTTIGKGAPNLEGSEATHGAPLEHEEIAAGKKVIDWPEEPFHVPTEVTEYFTQRMNELAELRSEWDSSFEKYEAEEAAIAGELKRIIGGQLPKNWEEATPVFPADEKGMASRASSGKVLNAFAAAIPEMVGGSADLAPSNKTEMTDCDRNGFVAPGEYGDRNIHFGVREHAMGNIVNGLALNGLLPFGATFLVFHDYMRPSLRLAAMQECRSIFVYTHDSFYVGEDGPTHQPIEQIASMRAIPRMHVLRPCDANECAQAWRHAISRETAPTALALTRQNLPTLDRKKLAPAEGTLLGGYVLTCDGNPDIVFIASGSEVHLALASCEALRKDGHKVRVVSMPGLNLFLDQPLEYQDSVIPEDIGKRVVIEAGIKQGWEGIIGRKGIFVGMDDFGISGPCDEIAVKLGFDADAITKKVRQEFSL